MNSPRRKNTNSLLAAIVGIVAFCSIIYAYTSPDQLYWDENYHITSAQKYLHGTFFMEPHPPLAKLLIAAGEWLIDANDDDSTFITTDHGRALPKDFSFAGYRLFPVLLAALSGPLFFLFLLRLSENSLLAFILSLGLMLDNAFVVHNRAAMLDGIQIFFVLGMLTGTTCVYRRLRKRAPLGSLLYLTGLSFGASIATKVTSLILLPFLLILIPPLWSERKRLLAIMSTITASALVIYVLIWQVHIARGKIIEPTLPDKGFYRASQESKQILTAGDPAYITSFWPLLRDNLKFFSHYERGVPKLNLCKQNENGSAPFLWPFGGRTINYRWDRKDGAIRYTYLVVNPIVWGLGLVGLIISTAFFVTSLLGRCPIEREWKLFAGVLLAMWFGYMGVMASLDRVMYLYHYFIPLLLTLALAAVTLPLIRFEFLRFSRAAGLLTAFTVLAIVCGFRFYAPLTYGYPLTNEQLASRAIFDMWDLRCPDCDLTNHLAQPLCNPKEKRFPQIKIGPLFATDSYQDWGDPIQGLAVEKQQVLVQDKLYDTVIGTHAASTLRFPIGKRFSFLRGKAALPDYLKEKDGKTASVVFEIWVDGIKIWRSRKLTPDDQIQDFELSVAGGSLLELRTLDGGDGNNNDHAVWLDTSLG